jgi:hypothetical protein
LFAAREYEIPSDELYTEPPFRMNTKNLFSVEFHNTFETNTGAPLAVDQFTPSSFE